MLAPPALSILAFAVSDRGQPLDERNRASRALMQAINARQRVNLTGTMLAFAPDGSIRRAAPADRSDYEAWSPE